MARILGIISSSRENAPSAPVSGYSVWLDASDTSTITVSGTSVTQWTDKSANSYTWTQGTASRQPQSGTRTINGKNVIDFDNGDTLSGTASSSEFKFTTDGDASFFIVILSDSNTGGNQIMTNNNQGSPGTGFFLGVTNANPGRLSWDLYRGVSGTISVGAGWTQPTFSTGTAIVGSILTDPANATAVNRSYIRINKGTVYNQNTSEGTPSSDNPTSSIAIGSAVAADDDWFDGAIAEIILYSSKLSDADRDKNIDYLMEKWGIS